MKIRDTHIVFGALVLAILGVIGLSKYERSWEARQPIQERKNIRVEKVIPYAGGHELVHCSSGTEIYLKGETTPIYFDKYRSRKNNVMNVKEGDIADITFRRSFLSGLDGLALSIKD